MSSFSSTLFIINSFRILEYTRPISPPPALVNSNTIGSFLALSLSALAIRDLRDSLQKTIKHNRFLTNVFSEKLTSMAYTNITAGIKDHDVSTNVRHIHLSYNPADLHTSALRLILTLFPDWEHAEGNVEFVRFTDGITNTLLKAVKRRPGYTEEQIDQESVLLRAYGSGTDVLIDRQRETASHSLLAQYNLAPPLLARFQNGLLYRFIRGQVCNPEDLRREDVSRAVARRLGEWHARIPIIADTGDITPKKDEHEIEDRLSRSIPNRALSKQAIKAINAITPGKPIPNLWTVMQKWIHALPTFTEAEEERKAVLQKELERTVAELGDTIGLGNDGLVFGHCDLLSGNVIIHPESPSSLHQPKITTVSFIDYEYATACPPAFELANHFAEWGGLSCDVSVLPTRSVRRAFLREYLESYTCHSSGSSSLSRWGENENREELERRLFAEVDRFRGIPGLYWGIWALIQHTISQIDFDYAGYAEVRLGEYWAWREQEGKEDGVESPLAVEQEVPKRERRWASE